MTWTIDSDYSDRDREYFLPGQFQSTYWMSDTPSYMNWHPTTWSRQQRERHSGLDPSRSWKTGWAWSSHPSEIHNAPNLFGTGREEGDYIATGNVWAGDRRERPQAGSRGPHRRGQGWAHEILDWGAYDKDPLYKNWLTAQGKDQFGSISDIIAAEDWMAAGGGAGGGDYDDELQALRDQLGSLRSDWEASIYDPSGLERLIGQLTTRLGDVESRNWSTEDIGNLDDQLDTILGDQQTGDQALQDLIDRYSQASIQGDEALQTSITDLGETVSAHDQDYRDQFLTQSNYETSMANRLTELQNVMRGEWGEDIQRLDLGAVREAIESGQGDLNALAQQFAGLQSGVTAGQTGLQNVITDLAGLRTSGETSLAELRAQLTARETALQDAISTEAGTLRAEGQATEEALRERVATGERALTAEGEAREARLTAAGASMEDRLTAAGEAREARLTEAGIARGEALTQRLEGLESRGADEIANLRTDLRDYYDRARAASVDELGLLEARLVSDYGDQLLSLDRTHQTGLGDVRSELREAVSGLSGQLGQARGDVSQQISNLYNELSNQRTEFTAGIGDFERKQFENLNKEALARITGLTDLSGKLQTGLAGEAAERAEGISDVRSDLASGLSAEATARREGLQQLGQAGMLGLQAEAAERHKGLLQEAGTRTKEISGLRGELTGALGDIEQRGAQAISDVYQSRAQQIADLESEWGRDLQTQEETLSKRVKSGEDALNKRLSELSQTMNYRMLGDSALGIKSRRSKAYKSGRTSTGTGQLSRGTKISTLNI